MAERHHSYTGILLIIFALLILLGAVFFTVAQTRVTEITEYKTGNSKLTSAKNNLIVAYILGYIAAGIAIVLSILYFGHVAWGIGSEIPHAILFILLFLLIIVSGIFGFVALNEINNAKVSDNKGSTGWIWAAEIAGLVAVILLIISGAWRAQYVSSHKSDKSDMEMSSMPLMPPKPESEFTFTAPTTIVAGSSMGAPGYPAPLPTSSYSSGSLASEQV